MSPTSKIPRTFSWTSDSAYFWVGFFNSGAAAEVDLSTGNTFYWIDGTPMSDDLLAYYNNSINSAVDFRQSPCSALKTNVTTTWKSAACTSSQAYTVCSKSLRFPCCTFKVYVISLVCLIVDASVTAFDWLL